MERINIFENGIYMTLEITDNNQLKLLHFSALPFDEKSIKAKSTDAAFNLTEISLTGSDRPFERHGTKYIVTTPGYRMKYHEHKDYRNEIGRVFEFTLHDETTDVFVTFKMQFYNGISVVNFETTVINKGSEMQTLEYISLFNYTGIEKEGILPRDDKIKICVPHNSWQREMNWQTYTLPQLGIAQSQKTEEQRSSKAVGFTNTGNWSTKEYLPMGYIENTETESSLFFQIEHNGSWHWEISDQTAHLYLALSGPNEQQSHWFKNLGPGDSFTTVPAAVGVSLGGFDRSMAELTKYRRIIRRPNADNESLAVIFNDYMNCLWGDPTEEKEYPLIDAAAETGCEYYCIDAGWYSAGPWWDNVGEWKESKERFPNGLKAVTDYIRSKGLIPGVWLELEVMGINCPKAQQVDDSWFFKRHGKKIFDRSRYQLDFRNPEVIAHADEVIDRLVNEYGIGYIKMDYNIEPGIGTETNADSYGDGLLEHERAYLAWLDRIFEKYPELIIENCSSGGMRIDYAMLRRHSIQSTSDQDDYKMYATIAANSPSGLCPEQSAIWSYPLTHGDKEEVVFNMVNALLLRVHQSGHLANLSNERKDLVKEALDCYKKIRNDIKQAVPFWCLGLSEFSDPWVSLGLKNGNTLYIALWRRNSEKSSISLDLKKYTDSKIGIAELIYPSFGGCEFEYNAQLSKLTVNMPSEYSARLFKITLRNC
ncbi:MAG: alpha-galactosidase [Oscillospiraceae bacterium]|nr:alpha-galactosidase [Oscillospiraceae bacterium]